MTVVATGNKVIVNSGVRAVIVKLGRRTVLVSLLK